MQLPPENSEARQRVLDAAEKLFSSRGYNSVTMRDIAEMVNIKHTSLYHHAPGGKEALYIEVIKRNLARHQQGLTAAIEQAAPDIRARLRAVAGWLLSQPPMDLIRLTQSDLAALEPAQAEPLGNLALQSLIGPVAQVLQRAAQAGEIAPHANYDLIGGGIISMIESLFSVPASVVSPTRQELAYDLLEIFLNGLRAGSSRD